MKDSPTCSRCGASRGLNLVTLHYSIDSPSGRILVYCAPCRENYRDHIGESIPLEQVSKEGFLELYRSNKTSSDPQTAVEIVFGKKDFNLVREAMRLLSLQGNAESNAWQKV